MRFFIIVAKVAVCVLLCFASIACGAQPAESAQGFSISSKTINALQRAAVLGNSELLPDCHKVHCALGTAILVQAVDARIHGHFAESNRFAWRCARSHDATMALTGMMCARLLVDQLALTSGYAAMAPALRDLIRETKIVCAYGINKSLYPNVHIDCANKKIKGMLTALPERGMSTSPIGRSIVPLTGGVGAPGASLSTIPLFPLLIVRVNGVPLRVVVDTGSGITMFTNRALAKAGVRLRPGLRTSVTDISAATASHQLVSIRHMQLADIEFSNVPAVVLKNFTDKNIDGILGLNVLEKLGSFAIKGKQFVIHPTIPLSYTCVPITIGSTLAGPEFVLMISGAQFDGRPVTAVLDTGSLAVDAEMTPYFARTHRHQPIITHQMNVTSTNGSYRVDAGYIMGRLSVLGKLYSPRVAYASGEQLPVDVVVGARAMKQRELFVDLGTMVACVSPMISKSSATITGAGAHRKK